jgi:prepilin peptidase CpaA
MLITAFTAIVLVYVFLVSFGALRDLSTFRIPNWVSYGIAGLFLVQSLFAWKFLPPSPDVFFGMPSFVIKLAIGFMVFVVSLIFWARGFIGGGDTKFLVATSLWMGPQGVVIFMVLVSALSLLMALFLKTSRTWGFLVHAGKLPDFVKRLYARLENNQLPFGFPIGIAALLMVPEIFAF